MRYLAIYIAGLFLLVAGMAAAIESELRWAPGAVGALAVVAVGVSVMLVKRGRERKTRSGARDSVEAVRDAAARAAVFPDAVVAIAVALLVTVIAPGIPGALVCLALLIALLIDYWLRVLLAVKR